MINNELLSKLRQIRIILTDVDGVLTDGSLIYGSSGEELKIFNARDGVAVQRLKAAGIPLVLVSGRDSSALRARIKDLNIEIYDLACKDKNAAVRKILADQGLTPEQAVFLGDDLADLPAFAACSLSACPADAAKEIYQKAQIKLQTKGGVGALRELTDIILTAQNAWTRDTL